MDSLVSHNTFTHAGTVSRISGNSIIVSLDENVQCEACSIKSTCGMSESRTKQVEIEDPDHSFSINENVNVVIKRASGLKAVFWAYIFPFLLLITVLLVSSVFMAEWLAGVLALAILVPYYIILRFLDSFFRKTFKISVIKLA